MARITHLIPGPSSADDTIAVALDGRDYLIRYRWYPRSDRWHIDLFDADGEPIVAGARVSPDRPLLRDNANPARPPGELVPFDASGDKSLPTRGDMGRDGERVQLYYVSIEDDGA